MKKSAVVQAILGSQYKAFPKNKSSKAFAASNIALCKYWGKRDQEINLPLTSSLSISLGNKGAATELFLNDSSADKIILNNQLVPVSSSFSKKLLDYLNLFRAESGPYFDIHIESNIPIAAGLASSACGFAALIKALDQLFAWGLSLQQLSILARLGSGSASRSLWNGFVEWHKGENADGMDSYAEPIADVWPEFCIGLLIASESQKTISSRDAMQATVVTSKLYSAWPAKVSEDLSALKTAIRTRDFSLLGATAESNAMNMHATMLSAWPPISYALPETLLLMQKIWKLREAEGLPIFFTQDAGPNLKLLFLEKNKNDVLESFPEVEIIKPFS